MIYDEKHIPKPPTGICSDARRFWTSVNSLYELTPDRMEALVEACHSMTRARQCRKAIKAHGLTYLDKAGQPKPRPEVAQEKAAQLVYSKMIQLINIDPTDVGGYL